MSEYAETPMSCALTRISEGFGVRLTETSAARQWLVHHQAGADEDDDEGHPLRSGHLLLEYRQREERHDEWGEGPEYRHDADIAFIRCGEEGDVALCAPRARGRRRPSVLKTRN